MGSCKQYYIYDYYAIALLKQFDIVLLEVHTMQEIMQDK